MKKSLMVFMLLFSSNAYAETLPFDLSIKSALLNLHRSLALSDIGEGKTAIHFDFKDQAGKAYTFDLNYKALPANRSFPSNLDITLKDAQGEKLGYLFFALNQVSFLKRMGIFGLKVKVGDDLLDVRFNFDPKASGNLYVSELGQERFVQDTLAQAFYFQMIRPVVLPQVKPGLRSITYRLDKKPYGVNFSLKDQADGIVQFQYNLYDERKKQTHLLERIYFQAGSLATLREAMFAGKYFHPKDGVFKLVFYPAMGQTAPTSMKLITGETS